MDERDEFFIKLKLTNIFKLKSDSSKSDFFVLLNLLFIFNLKNVLNF